MLLEQLSHPTFKQDSRNILSARSTLRAKTRTFRQNGERRYAETAVFWLEFFKRTLVDFYELDRDIVKGFRHFNDTGAIEILSCAATHGYLPLLGTDESVAAQIRLVCLQAIDDKLIANSETIGLRLSAFADRFSR